MSATLGTLRRDFGGDIIRPGDASYPSVSGSVLASGAPALVLRPRDVEDVRAAVRFAAGSGLALSVRGGGHGFQGFGTNDGGVVIDLRRLADVEVVDERRHLVRVGGGATWGEVTAALAPYGLAISAGDTKGVGVGGLTLAGGIGWKVRRYGLALDNVVAAQVVTADGEVLRASEQEQPDLFWALRGGGGNLGIVTAFEFSAHETTDVFFGTIAFPASQARPVLQGWADYLRSAPEELTSVATLANPMNGGPESPIEIHVAYDGDDAARAAEALAPIRGLGTVLEDHVVLTAYGDVLEEAPALPPGLQLVTRSAFVAEESVADLIEVVTDVAATPGSPFLAVRSVGGAVARIPDDATAYAYRRAELVILTFTGGPAPVVAAARPGLDGVWKRFAAHVHGAYANFLSDVTEDDVAAIYPTRTRQRLAEVKGRYDPANLFAGNHNIRPAEFGRQA